MKTLTTLLLLFTFHASATAVKGVVVNFLPNKLTLSINCAAEADLTRLQSNPKQFSIGYRCVGENYNYFLDFRLNDIDIIAEFDNGSNNVEINESQLNSYTLYDIVDKNVKGKAFRFVSYCSKDVCLDLVGDYDDAVKASITEQLRG